MTSLNNVKIHFFILSLILVIFTAGSIFAQESDPFAMVLKTKGEVILNHKHRLQPAETGTLIFNGDILSTKDNSLAIVNFSDNGAIIKLFSNSTLTIGLEKDIGIAKKLNLDSGNLWAKVTHNLGSFSVQTPTAVAAVKGTKFLTSVDPQTGHTTVLVFEGTIELGNEFGIVNIPSGNQGFSNGMEPPVIQPLQYNQIPDEIQEEIEAKIEIEEKAPQIEEEIEIPEAPPEQKKIEKTKAEKKSALPFPMSCGIGTVNINGKTYSQIRLMPEFSIWKFKLGLDFNLLIDSNGKLRKENWDSFEDYLNKFLYIQFAKKTDPFYCRFGSFPRVKYGQGLIMKDYTNMLNYPDKKQLGTEIAVNTNIYDLGFEAFCPNVYEADIFAARVKGKPLKNLDIPIIKNIQFGVTAATDLNQLGALKDSDGDDYPDKFDDFPDDDEWWADTDGNGWPDPRDSTDIGSPEVDIDANGDNILDANQDTDSLFQSLKKVYKLGKKEGITALGFDYIIPIINNKLFKLYNYGEFAQIIDYGNGFIFPGFGSHFLIFDLNLEYRIFGKEFEPNYFNYLYDNERTIISGDSVVTKESRLDSIKSSQGWRGELTTHLLNIIDLSVAYEDINGDDYNMGKTILGQVNLKRGLIPRLSYAYARYSQTKVKDLTTWKSPNATIETQIGYELSYNTILVANYKEYYEDLNDDGKIKGDDETITSFSFGVQFKF
ncbi:MAG: FecR family protein [Candidatus Cloacimonadota bacterium]|nr:FecR family protein [Candidatus Cloacimonadota bacterium]